LDDVSIELALASSNFELSVPDILALFFSCWLGFFPPPSPSSCSTATLLRLACLFFLFFVHRRRPCMLWYRLPRTASPAVGLGVYDMFGRWSKQGGAGGVGGPLRCRLPPMTTSPTHRRRVGAVSSFPRALPPALPSFTLHVVVLTMSAVLSPRSLIRSLA
jgi:hypothetical protein